MAKNLISSIIPAISKMAVTFKVTETETHERIDVTFPTYKRYPMKVVGFIERVGDKRSIVDIRKRGGVSEEYRKIKIFWDPFRVFRFPEPERRRTLQAKELE
jgi:hypothetical protein